MKTKLIITVYVSDHPYTSNIEKLRLTKLSVIDTTPFELSEQFCKTIEVDSIITEEAFQKLEKEMLFEEKSKSFGWTVERL
jgi:hypothetical protein